MIVGEAERRRRSENTRQRLHDFYADPAKEAALETASSEPIILPRVSGDDPFLINEVESLREAVLKRRAKLTGAR